jgi:hypothetical protein
MRSRHASLLIALCLALAPVVVAAQSDSTLRRPTAPATPRVATPSTAGSTGTTPNRDVILEIPELSVDSIGLTVQDVRAHVSLDANAMNFVQITAGVDVGIRKVQLGISGVLAEAYLYVDLDNVARIVDRVVRTLDRNPEILTQVLKTVDTTVNAATGQAGQRTSP